MVSLSCLVAFSGLVSISLLSQLTQADSEKASCSELDEWLVPHPPIQSYAGQANNNDDDALLDRVHLSHVLRPVVHPGSVLILTDCVTEFISSDSSLFSSLSLAILNTSMLGEIKPSLFLERRPFIVILLPEDLSRIAVKQIYDSFQVQSTRIKKWQPTILILRMEELVPGGEEDIIIKKRSEIMRTTFQDIRLHYDCAIYVIFPELVKAPPPPTHGNINSSSFTFTLTMAIWEAYSVNNRSRTFAMISSVQVPISSDNGGKRHHHNGRDVSLENFARRRRNFQLEEFTGSIKPGRVQYDPNFNDWVELEKGEGENGRLSIVGGYVSFIYHDLRMLMNFTENIILGDNPGVLPNGTAVGITANQLYSGEADLTLNQISFSVQRARAFTFLQPTYHSLIHAFFKQPAQSSIRDIVISAFETKLWITLIGVWAAIVLAMKLRLLILSRIIRGTALEVKFPFLRCRILAGDERFSNESGLWSVAAFTQKSWYLSPHSISLKMKVWIGSLTSLIAYTAYSASIVSHLAVGRVPVKSFDDLINFKFTFTVHEQSEPFQTLLEGMIESYSLTQDVTTTSTEREISHLYMGGTGTGGDPSSVKSTGMAFLSPADMFFKTAVAFNYSNTFMCDHISNLHAGAYLIKSAMLVKRGSEYKEILNYMLIYLRLRGLIDRNIQSYNMRNFLKCIPMDQRDNTVEPAEFSDVFSGGLVLFVGLPLATLLLIVEMTISRGYHGQMAGAAPTQPPLVKVKRGKRKRGINYKIQKQKYFDDLTTFYTA